MKQVSRFLIIDDDAGNNILCEILIKKTIGISDVQTFTEPLKAVHYIMNEYRNDSSVPTVLFLDINMPDMTGWEVLDKFRDIRQIIQESMSIYLVSSSVDENDKQRANQNPFVTEYIEKPLTAKKIREIVELHTENAPPVPAK
jgi:CheY-like chemotaxis protein